MDDVSKASGVVADMRKVFRQDTRIIQKLHRRVFIDKITQEQVSRLSSGTGASTSPAARSDRQATPTRAGCLSKHQDICCCSGGLV